MLIALMMSWAAVAQQPVTWQFLHGAADGSKKPAIEVTVNIEAKSLEVTMTCGGVQQSRQGPAKRGQTVRLEFPLPSGTHSCTGSLKGAFSDGSEGEAPLTGELKVPVKLSLTYTKDDLSLKEHTFQVRSSHPLKELQIEVYGPGGTRLGGGRAPTDVGSLGPHPIQWTQEPGEVVQLRLTALGNLGEKYSLDLWPWSYQIPHDDLNFASGSHAIAPSEVPKLQAAMGKIQAVLSKYGKGVGGFPIPIKLYVAGYTDTVGSKSSNKDLSKRRARSIAQWFKDQGFSRPIFIQGFGEEGLIRTTADEVEDAANRRALYMLSAWNPSVGPLIPRDSWKKLD
jgi:outer membrane protein OmpA-like peptidoglycan-associated protein